MYESVYDGRSMVSLIDGLERGDVDEVSEFHNSFSMVDDHGVSYLIHYDTTGGEGGSKCLWPTARCSLSRSLKRRSWFSIVSIAPSSAEKTVPASSIATNSS